MARQFIRASQQYLRSDVDAVPTLSMPFTVSAWFYPLPIYEAGHIWSISNSIWNHNYSITFGSSEMSYDARCRILDATTEDSAITTNTADDNKWGHYCALFTSTTSRTIVLNGDWANRGVSAISHTPGGSMQYQGLGAMLNSGVAYYVSNGYLAEAAIWNTTLTEAEIILLNMRQSPLLVRQGNLVSYTPLTYRSKDFDIVHRKNFTAINNPGWAEHPSGLTYPEPMPAMIGEQLPYFWTLPVVEEDLTQELIVSGIITDEAVGEYEISLAIQDITCDGIATDEVFGIAQLNQNVVCSGIATDEVIGIHQLNQNIVCAGTATSEAVGTHQFNQNVVCSGIITAEAIGDQTIANAVSTTFPFTDNFTGADYAVWDVTKWTTTVE